MEISDVRVKLIRDTTDRLKAVCIITFDDAFVVRDVKVVEGTHGLFVAMPSRKLSVHCAACNYKNHLRARYCNECGTKLRASQVPAQADGRARLHRDIAHPIKTSFREVVQKRVIQAYEAECECARQPDYRPMSLDADLEDTEVETDTAAAPGQYDAFIDGPETGGAHSRADDASAPLAPASAGPPVSSSEHRPRGSMRGRRGRGRRGPPASDDRARREAAMTDEQADGEASHDTHAAPASPVAPGGESEPDYTSRAMPGDDVAAADSTSAAGDSEKEPDSTPFGEGLL